MPLIYRHSVLSVSSDSVNTVSSGSVLSNPSDPTVTDADDSIVLSDLVRTGEASRLRRRGAIRLEHGPGSHITHPSLDLSDQALAAGSQRRWSYLSQVASRAEASSRDAGDVDEGRILDENRRNSLSKEYPTYSYHLFCGGKAPSFEMDSGPAFEPSILPLVPSDPTHRIPRQQRSSNGCGATIHTHASPRRHLGVWTAKSAATDHVVGMDPCYFDSAVVAKIVRSSCGCVREGIGCNICGNPLGTRYKPCIVAADSLFSVTSTSSCPQSPMGPFQPSGPRYWRQTSSSASRPAASFTRHPSLPRADPPCHIYTFFSHAVTSSPSYSFPVPGHQPMLTTPAPPPLNSELADDNGDSYVLGGAFVSSPTVSETSDENIEDARDGDGVRYDGDGIPIDENEIPTEPNSPEKYGSELMLVPER